MKQHFLMHDCSKMYRLWELLWLNFHVCFVAVCQGDKAEVHRTTIRALLWEPMFVSEMYPQCLFCLTSLTTNGTLKNTHISDAVTDSWWRWRWRNLSCLWQLFSDFLQRRYGQKLFTFSITKIFRQLKILVSPSHVNFKTALRFRSKLTLVTLELLLSLTRAWFRCWYRSSLLQH